MVSLTATLVKVACVANRWRCGACLEPVVLLENGFAPARRRIIIMLLIMFYVILRWYLVLGMQITPSVYLWKKTVDYSKLMITSDIHLFLMWGGLEVLF